MAKRFTDTNKYKKPFFRGLKAPYKLLWDFLYHDCDHTGIWIVDFELVRLYLGKDAPVNKSDALKYFNQDEERIIEIEGGKKWFIPKFIEFQYGELSEKNRAHTAIISALKKLNFIDENLKIKNFEAPSKPLISPLQGAMDMDKEQEKDKEQENMREKISIPFSEDFLPIWEKWKVYKKQQHRFTYKSILTEQAALDELLKLSGKEESLACAIINQSISQGWQGLFELKNNHYNGTSKNQQPVTDPGKYGGKREHP